MADFTIRELDILMAEKVMGWKLKRIVTSTWGSQADVWINEDEVAPERYQPIMVYDREWKPSSDISAAWQAVEKLADLGFDVIVSRVLDWRDKYECCLTKDGWRDEDRICKGADTAPMAICLAAKEVAEAA